MNIIKLKKIERKKQFDFVESLMKKKVKNHKKHVFKEVDQFVEDLEQCKKQKECMNFAPVVLHQLRP